MNNIFIGTSGYSYKDWEDNFYPAGVRPAGFLNYYSLFFNTVEINSTYYRIPNASMFLGMITKTTDNFIFSIKAPSSFTHTRDADDKAFVLSKKAIRPLKESGRLGSLLFQFPYSFKYSMQNLDYIKNLKNNFEEVDFIIEFRNKNWLKESVLNFLQDNSIGFCNVDGPKLYGLLPKTNILTSDCFYLRFHGRNQKNWWAPKEAYERYDYMYKPDELEEWVPKIKDASKVSSKSFIYFNNHYKAKSVKSAEILKSLL